MHDQITVQHLPYGIDITPCLALKIAWTDAKW